MTQAAQAGTQPPASNGAAAAAAAAAAGPAAAAAVKKEASPAPPDAAKVAAAAGGAGSRGGTPAADRAKSKSASPGAAGAAAAAAAAGGGTPEAGPAAEAPPSKEDEERLRLEDEIVAEGQAIAGVRALLAKAFSRPAEEPPVPAGHWSFLLQEAAWLANDMAQERLWKQAAAVAIAYEVARLKGRFGLRPPPEGQRRWHDEIAAARAAAEKGGAADRGGEKGGRRGSKGGDKDKGADAAGSAAAALKLDPADDPIFRDLETLAGELALPATPPNDDGGQATAGLCRDLVWRHDPQFQQALEEAVAGADIARWMREEIAAREYRFEYEAALASHHMAVTEQNRRAMRLDADMADAEGLGALDDDLGDDDEYGKKAKGRKRARSGYLLGDGFGGGSMAADETESVGGGVPRPRPVGGASAVGRQYIEDTYLQRKRRRERYKDVDVDYEVGMDTGRYGTRQNRALATRAGASRAQDPSKRKAAMLDPSYHGGGGQGAMGRHAPRQLPPGAVPGPVIWTKAEDDLLLAVTHEFGVNWTMVSEVLSLSLSMQGVFRPPHLCKQRFRQIMTPMLQQQAAAQAQPGTEIAPVDYSEERSLMALYTAMTKVQARELIVLSLPVHDDVMMRMLEALVQVGATAKQRRQLEEKRSEVRKATEPHHSHNQVHLATMAKTGGKHLSPMELAVQVDVAYAQQAKQHQMMAQQAQQAAQLQAQQAAAPPPPGQQQAAAAAQQQGGAPAPGGVQPPVQGMPAPASGAGVAAGTPAGAPGLGAQQQAAGGLAGGGTPPLPSPTGAAGQAPAGAGGRPAQPQITLQQLNHILETGKLPNGLPLEPNMRKAIEDKRNTYLQNMAAMQQRQVQQQQMAAMQQQTQQQAAQQQQAAAAASMQAAAAAAAQPGSGAPSAATQAALQAAQQAAAVQAGMRPNMGGMPPMPQQFRPGMPGGQPGMGGMGGMQPGLMQPQMGMPGMGLPPMQPGMGMSPATHAQQQQLIAQQFAMQQQVNMQAAAAAAAQPGAGHTQQ